MNPTYERTQQVREGDIYRGPRGGIREVQFWDRDGYSRWLELHAWQVEAPAPRAGRSLTVLLGAARRRRGIWMKEFEAWLETAELIKQGTGTPWPYSNCETCHGVGIVDAPWNPKARTHWTTCPTCNGESWV